MNLGMDDSGQRESGRHKVDPYRSLHTQWMMPQHQMPQHQMKDNHTMKLMNLISERDRAIIDRNQALKERREALEERDVAISQRDAAIMERTTAIRERDNAIAALEYAHENGFNYSTKPMHHQHQHHHQQHLQHVHPQPESPYNHAREMHSSETYPVAAEAKVRKAKRPRKESKVEGDPSKKASRAPRKNKRGGGVVEGSDQQLRVVKSDDEWRGEFGGGEDLNKDHHHDWKDQDLGLNQVTFDESMMPVPVCSCTGKYQQCYKWGNGGWQSACCTTTMSMYPLPVMANKRHARMGGRKMSGAVFTRLLSRLAAEGHDLSVPLDLKDHWSKHGTNRYITIK